MEHREVALSSLNHPEHFSQTDSDTWTDKQDIDRCFTALSRREEEVLRLCLEEMKYREIAAALEISPNSVATFHRRAIRKLRSLLSRPGKSSTAMPEIRVKDVTHSL
jgi:RNA polymerase sigma factor (sigma-70 family)